MYFGVGPSSPDAEDILLGMWWDGKSDGEWVGSGQDRDG